MIGDTCLSADAALTFNYSDGSTALKKCLLLPTDFVMDALNYTFFMSLPESWSDWSETCSSKCWLLLKFVKFGVGFLKLLGFTDWALNNFRSPSRQALVYLKKASSELNCETFWTVRMVGLDRPASESLRKTTSSGHSVFRKCLLDLWMAV